MPDTKIPQSWPDTPQFIVSLDYECDYGTAVADNSFEALEHTTHLIEILRTFDVPLSCFVQTEVLEERPEMVEELRNSTLNVEFYPHSRTHKPRTHTTIRDEVEQSTQDYRDYFGCKPIGYRFPNGNVRSEDYEWLDTYDYEFDASIFPSWRPGHFDNSAAPTTPQYLPEFDIYEIPFTVYSGVFRVPTALSYCRLLGRPFTAPLKYRTPEVVIFNIHMHDFVNTTTFDDLSPLYRAIYSRNTNGFKILRDVLSTVHEQGYNFGTIGNIHSELRR